MMKNSQPSTRSGAGDRAAFALLGVCALVLALGTGMLGYALGVSRAPAPAPGVLLADALCPPLAVSSAPAAATGPLALLDTSAYPAR